MSKVKKKLFRGQVGIYFSPLKGFLFAWTERNHGVWSASCHAVTSQWYPQLPIYNFILNTVAAETCNKAQAVSNVHSVFDRLSKDKRDSVKVLDVKKVNL